MQMTKVLVQSKVEKTIREMRVKKVTNDSDAPGDVLRLSGEDGLKLTKQLINNIY